jgi:hypothetical protein
MTDTAVLPTLPTLIAFVHRALCEQDHLDRATTPLVRTAIMQRGRLCGYVFHVEGPRQLRTSAVWSEPDERIGFYDSTGARVRSVILTESPSLDQPLKIAA